jgi:hypothetical protein
VLPATRPGGPGRFFNQPPQFCGRNSIDRAVSDFVGQAKLALKDSPDLGPGSFNSMHMATRIGPFLEAPFYGHFFRGAGFIHSISVLMKPVLPFELVM